MTEKNTIKRLNNEKSYRDNQIARLNNQLRVRDNMIHTLEKESDKLKQENKWLWGYIAVFSALVLLYIVLGCVG